MAKSNLIYVIKIVSVIYLFSPLLNCGADLSKTTSENDFFKCELNLHNQSSPLTQPQAVEYDYKCIAKKGKVQFNSLKVSYIASGKGLGESFPVGDDSVIISPGQDLSGTGTVRNVTGMRGSGTLRVQLSASISYPEDPLEDISKLNELEQDKINHPSKYNLLVSKTL